jgi:hypothetical protein
MTRCDLRNLECSCSPDECRAAPPRSPAPTRSASVRDRLVVIVFGTVMALLAAGFIHALDREGRQIETARRV